MIKKQNQKNRKNRKSFPLFTYLCLLVAVATMCTGMSFARYVTSSSIGTSGGVAAMLASFTVDEVSSTSFSNSDYWVEIEGQVTAQNTPREIQFSVRNYKTNIDGTKSRASGVDIQSTFRFHGSKDFLENIAFQIFKKGEGNSKFALTQQYVLPTIIENLGKAESISTASFVDYGEYPGRPEETLDLTNYSIDSNTNALNKFVAVAKTKVPVANPDGTTTEMDEHVATIALTTETRGNVNYEITQTRGREFTVDGSTANDMSAPEFITTYESTNVPYYCLDITVPAMTLKAEQDSNGNFLYESNQYIFAFTILKKESFDTAPTDKKINERFNVNGIDFFSKSTTTTEGTPVESMTHTSVNTIMVSKTLIENGNVLENPRTGYYVVNSNGNVEGEFSFTGNVVTFTEEGKEVTYSELIYNGTTYYMHNVVATHLDNPLWDHKASKEDYKIANAVKKVYPIDMQVLFTQASQT